jgi:hypothetical protein
VNYGKGVNFYVFSKPGVRMYIRMRMDHSKSALNKCGSSFKFFNAAKLIVHI